jgi:PKHD-type hydroxylase
MSTPDGPKIRCDFAATLFISGPDEYDGGELCLTHLGRADRIKLDAGDLFVYPAGTLHSVSPVSRGERLAVVFWIQSMVRDHDKRQMIANLDAVIGRIAERAPQSDDLRDLAGIFTNLVRIWADP